MEFTGFGHAGFCPDCRGMVAYISIIVGRDKDAANDVAKLVRDGFHIERVPVERARTELKECDETCPRIIRRESNKKSKKPKRNSQSARLFDNGGVS